MPDDLTPEILFERMPKAFIPEKAEGVDAVVLFDLAGDMGGQWVATIRDGTCTVIKGKVENPKLTLMADAADYVGFFTGQLNPMSAFAEGKVKLKGDLGLAMKLMNFFKMR